jgi:hypothetical protein
VYETALVLTASVIIGAYFVVTLPGLAAESQRFLVLAVPVLAQVALQPRIFHRLADYTLWWGRSRWRPRFRSLPSCCPAAWSLERLR